VIITPAFIFMELHSANINAHTCTNSEVGLGLSTCANIQIIHQVWFSCEAAQTAQPEIEALILVHWAIHAQGSSSPASL
jgi:hypothetical protein